MSATEVTTTGGMFAQLAPMLKDCTLLITVSTGTDEALTVNVIPKGGDGRDNAALKAPLCFTGTAEELDREWLTELRSFVDVHEALSSNLAEIKAEMEQAEKEARAKARKKSAAGRKSEPSKPAPPPEPPKPAAPTSMNLFETGGAQEQKQGEPTCK